MAHGNFVLILDRLGEPIYEQINSSPDLLVAHVCWKAVTSTLGTFAKSVVFEVSQFKTHLLSLLPESGGVVLVPFNSNLNSILKYLLVSFHQLLRLHARLDDLGERIEV